MDAPGVGQLGGTFSGNPLACEAALAVLEIIEKENLCARANLLGERFRKRAAKWQTQWEWSAMFEEWRHAGAGTGALEGDAATCRRRNKASITVLLRARL